MDSLIRSPAPRSLRYDQYGYRGNKHLTRGRSQVRRGHSYYRRHGLNLGNSFGGRYAGYHYHNPFYSHTRRAHYGFFYPGHVTWGYVPYGFYYPSQPVYVTERVYVRDNYASTDYEDVEINDIVENGSTIEPEPAAGSPATEKFLRDGSKAFHEANYKEAARQFRLAAIATPDNAAPLFALGQALIALGNDDYAHRVVRMAIERNPDLVKEPGNIVGVYKSQAEFDRVLGALAKRAEANTNEHAAFLLAVQRYFTGDPRARTDFRALAEAAPEDKVIVLFTRAVEIRFRAEKDLPPIE